MIAMNDDGAIGLVLERHRFFQECLLRQVCLSHFATELKLEFEYIWDDADLTGSRLAADPRTVVLALEGLHEARIVTALPPALLHAPERADWGLTEVAFVRLLRESDLLAKHHESDVPLHHLVVEWEGDRRIDAVFARLRIEEARRRP